MFSPNHANYKNYLILIPREFLGQDIQQTAWFDKNKRKHLLEVLEVDDLPLQMMTVLCEW